MGFSTGLVGAQECHDNNVRNHNHSDSCVAGTVYHAFHMHSLKPPAALQDSHLIPVSQKKGLKLRGERMSCLRLHHQKVELEFSPELSERSYNCTALG